MEYIKINNTKIGDKFEPYIVAEMSGNHNQNYDFAKKIIQEAASSGAHAIKLQTYTADTMTLNVHKDDFKITDPSSLWSGHNLYELYEKAHTPWEWHKDLFNYSRKLGIACFSTPFDSSAVDFLEELNTPAYKISSFENNDSILLKRVAETGKPVIISTGMASISDIGDIVEILEKYKCKEYMFLKCTSNYPASASSINLKTIKHMKEMLKVPIGLSDHTLGIGVSLASIGFGANLIEKHFTCDKSVKSVDSAFSIDGKELEILCQQSTLVWESIGEVHYGSTIDEKESNNYRRSIYVSRDVKKGDYLNINNVKSIRPGKGMRVKYFDIVLGKKFKQSVKKGTPLNWELIE